MQSGQLGMGWSAAPHTWSGKVAVGGGVGVVLRGWAFGPWRRGLFRVGTILGWSRWVDGLAGCCALVQVGWDGIGGRGWYGKMRYGRLRFKELWDVERELVAVVLARE